MLKQIIIILLFLIPVIGYAQFPGAPTITNKKISHNVKLQNVEGSSLQMAIPFSDYIKDSSGVYSYRHVPFDSIMKYKGGNFTYLISNLSDTLLMKPVCGDLAIKTIDSCAKDVYIYRCTPNSYSANRIGWYNSGSLVKRSCLGQGGGGGSTSDVRWGGFTVSGDSIRLDSVSNSGMVLGSKWIANVVNKTELDIYKVISRYLSTDSLIISTYSWSDALQQYVSNTANTVYIDNCINKKVKYEKINDTTLVYYQPDFGNDTIIVSSNFTMYAKNGLHAIGDTAYLGGTLDQNTRVSGGNNTYSITFDSITAFRATNNFTGNIRYDFRTSKSNLLNYWTVTDSTNNFQVFLKMNSSLPSYGFIDLSTNKSAYIRPYSDGSNNVIEIINDGYGSSTISSSGNEQLSFTNGVDAAPKLFFYNIQNDSLNLGSKFGTVLPLPTKPIKVGYIPKLININTAEWAWGPDSIVSKNWYNTDDTLTTDRIAEGNLHNARWTNMTMVEFDSIGSFWIRSKSTPLNWDATGNIYVSAGTAQLLCNNPNGYASTLGGRQGMALVTNNNAELRSQPFGSSGTAYTINSVRVNDISAAIEMPRVEYDGTYSYARATYLGVKIREGTIPIAYRHGGGTRDNTGGRLIYSPYRFPLYAAPDSNYVLTSRGDSLMWKLMSSGGGGGGGSLDSTWYKYNGTLTSNRLASGNGFDATWRDIKTVRFDSTETFTIQTKSNPFAGDMYQKQYNGFGTYFSQTVNPNGYGSSIGGRSTTIQHGANGASIESRPNGATGVTGSNATLVADDYSCAIKMRKLEFDNSWNYADVNNTLNQKIRAGTFPIAVNLGVGAQTRDNTQGYMAYSRYRMPISAPPANGYILLSEGDSLKWALPAADTSKEFSLMELPRGADFYTNGMPRAGASFFVVPASMNGYYIKSYHVKLTTAASGGTSQVGLSSNGSTTEILNTNFTIGGAGYPATNSHFVKEVTSSYQLTAGEEISFLFKNNSLTGTPRGLTITVICSKTP